MKVGFTGTREGMTDAQYDAFEVLTRELYSDLSVKEFHHGGCVGADAEAHMSVDEIGGVFMHIHPCNLYRQQATDISGDFEYAELPPLTRNKVIVESVDVMIATPSGFDEQFRGSGTWATIRHSRRTNTPLHIIYPDGSIKKEQEDGVTQG